MPSTVNVGPDRFVWTVIWIFGVGVGVGVGVAVGVGVGVGVGVDEGVGVGVDVGVGVGVGVGVPHSGVVFAPLTLELPESPALLLARTR